MSTTIPGLRIEYSTKQPFDVYDIFRDVVQGFCMFQFEAITIETYNEHAVVVRDYGFFVSDCHSAEELEIELERLGLLEP